MKTHHPRNSQKPFNLPCNHSTSFHGENSQRQQSEIWHSPSTIYEKKFKVSACHSIWGWYSKVAERSRLNLLEENMTKNCLYPFPSSCGKEHKSETIGPLKVKSHMYGMKKGGHQPLRNEAKITESNIGK